MNNSSANQRVKLLTKILCSILAGAIVFTAFGFFSGIFNKNPTVIHTEFQNSKVFDTGFVEATSGDCITWNADSPDNRQKVDCNEPHRFEVAQVLDKTNVPKKYQELLNSGNYLTRMQWHDLEKQSCKIKVFEYLANKFDLEGKFNVSMLVPTEKQWQENLRKIVCGLQLTEFEIPLLPPFFVGKVANQDQAVVFPVGSCAILTKKLNIKPVSCDKPHFFEVTGVYNFNDNKIKTQLKLNYKSKLSVSKQNKFLNTYCYHRSVAYLGEKKLRNSTLITSWTIIKSQSWNAGTRFGMCYMMFNHNDKYGVLVGSAKSKSFSINGLPPRPVIDIPPGRSLPTDTVLTHN